MGCVGSKTETTTDATWSTFDAAAMPKKSALKSDDSVNSPVNNSGRRNNNNTSSRENFNGVGIPSSSSENGSSENFSQNASIIKKVSFLDEITNQLVGPQDEPDSHGNKKGGGGSQAEQDPLSKVDNSLPAFVSLGVVDDDNIVDEQGEEPQELRVLSNTTDETDGSEGGLRTESADDGDDDEGIQTTKGRGSRHSSNISSSKNNLSGGGGGANPFLPPATNSQKESEHHQEIETMHEVGRSSSPISPAKGSGRNSPSLASHTGSENGEEAVTETYADVVTENYPPTHHHVVEAGAAEAKDAGGGDRPQQREDDGESPSNTNNNSTSQEDTSGVRKNSSQPVSPLLRSALHVADDGSTGDCGGDDGGEGGEKSRRRVSFTNRRTSNEAA